MHQEPTKPLDFTHRAATYALHRRTHPGVIEEIIAAGCITAESDVLDVGCGTGMYAALLGERTRCRISGVEPSAGMLARARNAAPWESLQQGSAEQLPFVDNSFALVMSTDVIHHVSDRLAYFREAGRVLRSGGRIVTVTDSHDDIPERRPLSSHFPETVAVELNRYPPISELLSEMSVAGFEHPHVVRVREEYGLTDDQAYRDRAFSSLLLIPDDAFQRGLDCLESDLAHGPIPCLSLYTLIWGKKSDA